MRNMEMICLKIFLMTYKNIISTNRKALKILSFLAFLFCGFLVISYEWIAWKISETVIKYAKIKDSFRFCEFHLQYDICIMIISLLGAIMEGDICIF